MTNRIMELADAYAAARANEYIRSLSASNVEFIRLSEMCTASRAALLAEVERVSKDAERWQTIKPLFRIMSLHMDGNHVWVMNMNGRLVGGDMDQAVDRLKGSS